MTFIDYVRRAIDPMGAQERAAPSRRPNAVAQRNNRRNPNLPQDNESFADFNARGGRIPAPARIPVDQATQRLVQESERNAELRSRYRDTPQRAANLRDREIVGRAMVDANNTPSARLLDIPVGATREGIDPGRPEAQGYTYNPRTRELGLIRWGVDTRRSLRDVVGDVEIATGAPGGYLLRLSGKESNGNVDANPGTSSAQGYFQVIDDTWDTWAFGNRYHPDLGQRFRQTYQLDAIPNDEFADYRRDARVDGAMAAEIARHSYSVLRGRGVRNINEGHLYLGHFGGPNGLELAYDETQGRRWRHRLGLQYFTPGEVEANTPVFFYPKLDANGRPMRERISRNGRPPVWMQVPDRSRPRTSQEVWDYLTRPFNTRDNVQFRARANGTEDPLMQ